VSLVLGKSAQTIPAIVGVFIVRCLTVSFMNVLPAVTYFDLRQAREGSEIMKIATVFD
jgi:hypothetical protein